MSVGNKDQKRFISSLLTHCKILPNQSVGTECRSVFREYFSFGFFVSSLSSLTGKLCVSGSRTTDVVLDS